MATKKAESSYGTATGESVEREIKAMNKGELKSGGSGKEVANLNQATVIGLSEARKSGAKVPPAPKKKG